MSSETGLSTPQMARLTAEVRGATRRLSAEQMLELADMLHDAIRTRREIRASGYYAPGAGLRSARSPDA